MKKSEKLFANSSSDSESDKGFSEMFPVMLLNSLYSFLVSHSFSTMILLMEYIFLACSAVL